MDLALSQENGASLLIDNDAINITESPIPEIESDHSEGSTESDIQIASKRNNSSPNILDKSFSVDENELATPLEPIHIENFPLTSSNGANKNGSNSDISEKSEADDGYVEENLEDDSNAEIEESFATGDMSQREGTCECDNNLMDILSTNVVSGKSGFPPGSTATIPEIIQETDILTGTNDQISSKSTSCTSILRGQTFKNNSSISSNSTLNSQKYTVSFPSDISDLVSYWEPEYDSPWTITKEMPSEEILQTYQNSCKKHKTVELDTIKSQINEIKNNTNHSATLKLHSLNMTSEVNETLEDLLKVTNFHTLILSDCKFTSETMNEFLNMLEYYESVCHFEIEMNFDDEDTWKCFCSACSNITALESLSFKKMGINETYMRCLLSAVRSNPSITMLKFDSCVLIELPNFYLVESLMSNTTIRELYLPSTGLYTKEAEVLARFLQNNTHLKVLDIGNNFIGDRGLESLAKGLCKQNIFGVGLSALSVFNNQITEKSGPIINNIIVECKNLHTLNIGYNNLTDEVLNYISSALPLTNCLEGLGLQCTLLTCKGVKALAAAIPHNQSLQKISLKGNKAIQIEGVESLCQALTNSKVNKIEIDENNRSCNDPENYSQFVKKLMAICTVNKSFTDAIDNEEVTNISLLVSRKMSLSCEPRYTLPEVTTTFQIGSLQPSPIPSPISSPAPKSRFQIVKVSETSSSCSSTSISPSPSPSPKPKSRFHVSRVPPSPDEEVSLGRFANVRSSVSSNDSMDSLTTLHLDSDSE